MMRFWKELSTEAIKSFSESFRIGSPWHFLKQGLATFQSDMSYGDHCSAT